MEDLTSLPQDVRGTECAADSDDALLRQFADGDAGAARALTDRLAPRCFSVALRMLGNRTEAEDVTQDAMMRLWKMAPKWVSGQAKVSTWLYRVTLNLCVDVQRKNKPDRLDDVPEPEDNDLSAAEKLQEAARKDALQTALSRLPERQKQAVILRHIEELPNPEIAGIMGISTEGVESLTARGKRGLAAILAGRQDELGYEDD